MRTRNQGFICGVLAGLYAGLASANPQGPQVVHGTVSLARPDANTLSVTNSPNAVINWQGFSINANEVTRFVQQSANSAVLNRVVGQNPSQILGQMQSNGRVFLINPNGVVFGPSSRVDTAGLIASTLNISNQDFLAGKYQFEAGVNPGNIENAGILRAGENGEIVLIAPSIENSGIIQADDGKLILAAGRRVAFTSLDVAGVQFEIQAPEDSVVNVGELIARRGTVGAFAGTLRNTGTIQADGVSVDAEGNIVLTASADIHLDKDSRITASGASGGGVTIESQTGTTWVEGTVEATGAEGRGGRVHLLGERVAVTGEAQIDASGPTGGGEVLVGGDYQGGGDVRTSQATYVGRDTAIRADAIEHGDGGEVIVWADETARVHGEISARGGAVGGDGGLVETSGKENLSISTVPDVSAPAGDGGTWLIDPNDITVVPGGGATNISATNPFTTTNDGAVLGVDLITAALRVGANVTVTTGTGGGNSQSGQISLNAPLDIDATIGSNLLTFSAADSIFINQPIMDSAPGGQVLSLTLQADSDFSGDGAVFFNADVNLGPGTLTTAGLFAQVDNNAQVLIDASTWFQNADVLQLGVAAAGRVTVQNGGALNANTTGGVVVGGGGSGTLEVLSAAGVSTADLAIATAGGSAGTVTVDGDSSELTASALLVGLSEGTSNGQFSGTPGGDASLTITGGGRVAAGTVLVGGNAATPAVVRVDGAGANPSRLDMVQIGANPDTRDRIVVGHVDGTQGRLEVINGAVVNGGPLLQIGRWAGSTGSVLVDNATLAVTGVDTSFFNAAANLSVGRGGIGTLDVRNAGQVRIDSATLTPGDFGGLNVGGSGFVDGGERTGIVTVDGAGSRIDLLNGGMRLRLGREKGSSGTLNIVNGAEVRFQNPNSDAFAIVAPMPGTGEVFNAGGSIPAITPLPGAGELNIGAGSRLDIDGDRPGTGALLIGLNRGLARGGDATVTVAGSLVAGNINNADVLQNSGAITASTITNSGNLDGGGAISAGTITNTGVLTGAPSVTGNLVDLGGVIAPGGSAAGTIRIDGNLTLDAKSTLEMEVAGTNAGETDLIDVTGSASLAGTLTIEELGGFENAIGDSFAPVTYASATGDFRQINPSFGDVIDATRNATDFTVTVTDNTNFVEWVGGTSLGWVDRGNWNTGAVPTREDDVRVDTAGGAIVVTGSGAEGANRLQMNAALTIDGAAFELANRSFITGQLTVEGGNFGVQDGAQLTTGDVVIGEAAGSNGAAILDGGTWNASELIVGGQGSGALSVQNGGNLVADRITLGDQSGVQGTMTVFGPGSRVELLGAADRLLVGNQGIGVVVIQDQAVVDAAQTANACAADTCNTLVADLPGSTGGITISGAGSRLDTLDLDVGVQGAGTLIAQNRGAVNVTGEGGVRVGLASGSNGTLNVLSGGAVDVTTDNFRHVEVGIESGATGAVSVSGRDSRLTTTGFDSRVVVATAGSGTLGVEDGGLIETLFLEIGRDDGSVGQVTVTGQGSAIVVSPDGGGWSGQDAGAAGFARVGRNGGSSGRLEVLDGGHFIVRGGDDDEAGSEFQIARNIGSTGEVIVDGVGSVLEVSQRGSARDVGSFFRGPTIQGRSGGASLTVSNGADARVLGQEAFVRVSHDTGPTTQQSTFDIVSGGRLRVSGTNASMVIGDTGSAANGRVTVSGANSMLDINSGTALGVGGGLAVGNQGIGELRIEDGAIVTVASGGFNNIDVARQAGANDISRVTVTGAGSRLVTVGTDNTVQVGRSGVGELTVSDGGEVDTLQFEAGRDGTGTATITGTGSRVIASNDNGNFSDPFFNEAGFVRAGREDGATGTIDVLDGGRIEIRGTNAESGPELQLGRNIGSVGNIRVDGAGSVIELTQTGPVDAVFGGPRVHVGRRGEGNLTVSNAGEVTLSGERARVDVSNAPVSGGNNPDPNPGPVTAQSTLDVSGGGRITVDAGSTDARLRIGRFENADGVATVSGTGSAIALTGNTTRLVVGRNTGASGSLGVTNGGTVTLDGTSNLAGAEDIIVGRDPNSNATITVDATSSIAAGTAAVVGRLASAGIVRGHGTINANLAMAGGILRPGSAGGVGVGALTIGGDLGLAANSRTEIDVAGTAPGTFDTVNVSGDASLAGTVAVEEVGGFESTVGNSFASLTFAGGSGDFAVIDPSFGDVLSGVPSPTGFDIRVEDNTNFIDWLGGTSANWTDAANWSGGQVPTIADDVRVNSVGEVIVNGGMQAANRLQAGAALVIDGGGELEIGDRSTVDAVRIETGGLTVRSGASLASNGVRIGTSAGSVGTATLAGGTWTDPGLVVVGEAGTGTLAIQPGSTAEFADMWVAARSASTGTVTVSGSDTLVTLNAPGRTRLDVGQLGNGSMNILGGAVVDATAARDSCGGACNVSVGNGAGSNAELTIDGAGSRLDAVDNFGAGGRFVDGTFGVPGGNSTATVRVANGALLNINQAAFGNGPAGAGTTGTETTDVSVTVDNATLNARGFLSVANGPNASADVSVSGGGRLSTLGVSVGSEDAGASGSVIVQGTGAEWINNGFLGIGNMGTGDVTIENGAALLARDGIFVGVEPGSTGTLTVQSGGTVDSTSDRFNNLRIGEQRDPNGVLADADGSVVVSGAGSTIVTRGTNNTVEVGSRGTGTLRVEDGGVVDTLQIRLGREGDGTATITGAGSQVIASTENGRNLGFFDFEAGFVRVGREPGNNATLNVADGGQLIIRPGSTRNTDTVGALLQIARNNGSVGNVTVNGAGSLIDVLGDNTPDLEATQFGNGVNMRGGMSSLQITNGGEVRVAGTADTFLNVGSLAGSAGNLLIRGEGSRLSFTSDESFVNVGREGRGTLTIDEGGVLEGARSVDVAQSAGSAGTVFIDGSNDPANTRSTLSLSGVDSLGFGGQLRVGLGGTGSLEAFGGALVSIGSGAEVLPSLVVGGSAATSGGTGTVSMIGAGTEVRLIGETGNIQVGRDGNGFLLVDRGAAVTGGTLLRLGASATSNGTVTVRGIDPNDATRSSINLSGRVGAQVEAICADLGCNALAGTPANLQVGDLGTGTITVDEGATLTIDPDGTGVTPVANTIRSAGRISGTGDIVANVDNRGGTVTPGSVDGSVFVFGQGETIPAPDGTIGTLTINGNLSLDATSELDIELFGPNPEEFDALDVSATGIFGGTLRVGPVGGYEPIVGDAFTIVESTSTGGRFDDFIAPPGFEVTVNPANVVVSVGPPPDLDFIEWIGGFSLNWTDAANWGGGEVPTTDDDVRVTQAAGPILVDGDNVTLGANVLEMNPALTIDGGAGLRFEIADASFIDGTLTIENGTFVVLDGASLSTRGSTSIGANGIARVDGGTWLETSSLSINALNTVATDNLIIANGGVLNTPGASIGNLAGFQGVASITGAGSAWNATNGVTLAAAANTTAGIDVLDGGTFSAPDLSVATNLSAVATVNVDGAGSSVQAGEFLNVGQGGLGTLNITGGGAVAANDVKIGGDFDNRPGGDGTINVSGAGSRLDVLGLTPSFDSNLIWVGHGSGVGRLNIGAGATVTVDPQVAGAAGGFVSVARHTASEGLLTVDGVGSTLITAGTDNEVDVGEEGQGTMTVSNGGRIESLELEVGRDGTGVATITGVGSTVVLSNDRGNFSVPFSNEAGFLRAGRNAGGDGTIQVLDGGVIEVRETNLESGPGLQIARNLGSRGSVEVDGAGSRIDISQASPVIDGFEPFLTVGARGEGNLTISNGGEVRLAGPDAIVNISRGNPADGFGGSADPDAGPVTAQSALGITGGGRLVVDGIDTAANLTIGSEAEGNGIVTVDGAGTEVSLTGAPGSGFGAFLSTGFAGAGILEITDGALVNIGGSSGAFPGIGIGGSLASATSDAVGTVTVSGPDSEIRIAGDTGFIGVGRDGTGTLNITNGGEVSGVTFVTVAEDAGSEGTVNIDGSGSVLALSGITSAAAAAASANATEGGAAFMTIGRSGTGVVDVTGGGSLSIDPGAPVASFDNRGGFSLGGNANASGGDGTLMVDGADSSVIVGGEFGSFAVGVDGSGALGVSNGGLVRLENPDGRASGFIGVGAGSTASVTVAGPDSQLDAGQSLLLGLAFDEIPGGAGDLQLSGQGRVAAASEIRNAGTIVAPDGLGGGILVIGQSLDNEGIIDMADPIGFVSAPGFRFNQVSGVLDVGAGETLAVPGGVELNWLGGTFRGSGGTSIDVSAASLRIDGPDDKFLDGATLITGDLEVDGGALRIESGTLNPLGTTTVGSGASVGLAGGVFETGGDVTLQGVLDWGDGDLTGTGDLSVDPGGLLALNGTQSNTLDGRSVNNAGTTRLAASGTLILDNGATLNNTSGGRFEILGAGMVTGGAGGIENAGTVEKSGSGEATVDVSLNNNNIVSVTGGTLALRADGTHESDFDVAAGGELTFASGTHTLVAPTRFDGDGAITNSGTLRLAANGDLALDNGAMLNNAGSGRFEILGAGSVTGDGGIENAGTVEKSGSGEATIDVRLNSSILVSVTGGRLALQADGSHGGDFNVAAGGELAFASGTHTLVAPTRFDSDGAITNSGTLRLAANGDLALDNSAMLNNAGSGRFEILGAGSVTGTGGIENTGTVEKSGAGEATVDVPLNNNNVVSITGGTLVLRADGTHGSDFNVAAGGELVFASGTHTFSAPARFDGDGTISNSGATWTGGGTLTNNATIELTGGTVALQGDLVNDVQGAIDVQMDGTLAANSISNAGEFLKSSAGTTIVGAPFENSGDVQVQSGSLAFQGGYSQTSTGSIAPGDGTTVVIPGGFELSDGMLAGSGTFATNVNNTGGTVAPGASPGRLTIVGDYVQGPGGTLEIEVDGTAPSQFDVLAITGQATLGGILNVTVADNLPASAGDTVEFLEFGSLAQVSDPIGTGGLVASDFTDKNIIISTNATLAANLPADTSTLTNAYPLTFVPGVPPPEVTAPINQGISNSVIALLTTQQTGSDSARSQSPADSIEESDDEAPDGADSVLPVSGSGSETDAKKPVLICR